MHGLGRFVTPLPITSWPYITDHLLTLPVTTAVELLCKGFNTQPVLQLYSRERKLSSATSYTTFYVVNSCVNSKSVTETSLFTAFLLCGTSVGAIQLTLYLFLIYLLFTSWVKPGPWENPAGKEQAEGEEGHTGEYKRKQWNMLSVDREIKSDLQITSWSLCAFSLQSAENTEYPQ